MASLGSTVSARGLLRALARIAAALLLLALVYLGLARAGVIDSPFSPVTRGDLELARSDKPGLRVLFVGNSFTFANDMPHMVQELAEGNPGGPAIFSVSRTRGGWTLEGAADDKGLDSLLEDVRWDDVVLQERSWVLSFGDEYWLRTTYPYAEELRRKIEAAGSDAILVETWGYREGLGEEDSYDWMQQRLLYGVTELAERLGMDVAPVGNAWWAAHPERHGLALWDADGRHPSRAGSYLAACVFYKQLTGHDPAESTYTAGLDPELARYLQEHGAGAAWIH